MVPPFDAQSAARRMVTMLEGGGDRPVADRATLLPIGQYDDGSLTLAWPGFVVDAVEGAQRSLLQASGKTANDADGTYLGPYQAGNLDALNAASIGPMGGVVGRMAGAIPRGALGSGGSDAFFTKKAPDRSLGPSRGPEPLSPKAEAIGTLNGVLSNDPPVPRSKVLAENAAGGGQAIAQHAWRSNHPYERAEEIAEALRVAFPDRAFPVTRSGSAAGDSAYIGTGAGSIRISDHFAHPKADIAWSDGGRNAEGMSPESFVEFMREAMSASAARQAEQLAEEAKLLAGPKPKWMSGFEWKMLKDKHRGRTYANPDTSALPALVDAIDTEGSEMADFNAAEAAHRLMMMDPSNQAPGMGSPAHTAPSVPGIAGTPNAQQFDPQQLMQILLQLGIVPAGAPQPMPVMPQ